MKYLLILSILFSACAVQYPADYNKAGREADNLNAPPTAVIQYQQGCMNYSNQKYPDAILNFTRAISYYSDFGAAYFFRGLIKVKLSQFDSAVVNLNRAGELGYGEAFIYIEKIKKREKWENIIINL